MTHCKKSELKCTKCSRYVPREDFGFYESGRRHNYCQLCMTSLGTDNKRASRSELKCRKCREYLPRDMFVLSEKSSHQTCNPCRSLPRKNAKSLKVGAPVKATPVRANEKKCWTCMLMFPKEQFEPRKRTCRSCVEDKKVKKEPVKLTRIQRDPEYAYVKPKAFIPSVPTYKPFKTCTRCWGTKKVELFIDDVCSNCEKIIKGEK